MVDGCDDNDMVAETDDLGLRKRLNGPELDGPEPFWKKYKKVPIKIGIGMGIAIGFVFLYFSLGAGKP